MKVLVANIVSKTNSRVLLHLQVVQVHSEKDDATLLDQVEVIELPEIIYNLLAEAPLQSSPPADT